MSDEAMTGGSDTQGGGAAQTAPNGGGHTSAQSAPETQTQTSTPDKGNELDGLWRKAYREGQGKGRERERKALLAELGFDSVDDLRGTLEQFSGAEQQQVEASQQAHAEQEIAESKALRRIREERSMLARELDSANQRIQRFEHQSKRALQMDVRGRLLKMGVIGDAVEDAVGAVSRNLRWSADGHDIEVFERDGEEEITSRHSIDDYLGEFRKNKPWFFEAPQKTGSGDTGNGRPIGSAQYTAPPGGDDFRTRFRKYAERKM